MHVTIDEITFLLWGARKLPAEIFVRPSDFKGDESMYTRSGDQ